MAEIEWAMWANEQAVTSSAILLLGSIICISGMFNLWQFGIYGVIISIIIAAVEWPRSKRRKGNTMERKFQQPFVSFVNKLGVAGRNYFVRFVFYLITCVPCCFTLSTLLGGICLLITGIIYFVAALKGEQWSPVGLDKKDTDRKERTVKSLDPPKKPPPRATQVFKDAASADAVTVAIVEERPPPCGSASKPTRPPPKPRTAAASGIQGR